MLTLCNSVNVEHGTGYYPEVLALYRKLRILARKSDFTYSFASISPLRAPSANLTGAADADGGANGVQAQGRARAPAPQLIYNGHSGAKGFSIPSSLLALAPSARTLRSPASTFSYIRRDLQPAVLGLRDYLSLLLLFVLSYFALLLHALYHHHLGHTRSPTHALSTQTLGEWAQAKRRWVHPRFVERVVVPLFSAVMTAQAESVREAPVAEVLEYVAATFLRSHYTVLSGVHEVQRALSRPLVGAGSSRSRGSAASSSSMSAKGGSSSGGRTPHHVHTNAQVVEIGDTDIGAALPGARVGAQSDAMGAEKTLSVLVRDVNDGSLALYDGFHHIIFATQANQSASFIGKYITRSSSSTSDTAAAAQTHRLRQMVQQLEAFRYEHSSVINHTDRSMMPPDRKDWRDLNLVTPSLELLSRGGSGSGSSANSIGSSKEEAFGYYSSSPSPVSHLLDLSSADEDHASNDSALSFSSIPGAHASAVSGAGASAQGLHPRALNNGIQSRSHSPAPASAHTVAPTHTQTMATHVIAQDFPSSNGPQLLMQTTNALPGMTPRPETVLSISNFHRAVLTREGKAAQRGLFDWVKPAEAARRRTSIHSSSSREQGGGVVQRLQQRARSAISTLDPLGTRWTLELGKLQGGQRQRACTPQQLRETGAENEPQIWVCGSWSPGIPLLEGCVRSARLVCEEIIRQEGL